MRTESATTEGNDVLLKLHSSAHLSRTGHGGTRTRIVHSRNSPLRAQQASPQSTPQTIQLPASRSLQPTPCVEPGPAELRCRRRSSCVSTHIGYPVIPDCAKSSTDVDTTRESTETTARHGDIHKNATIATGGGKRAVGFASKKPLESRITASARDYDFDRDDEEEEEECEVSMQAIQTENYNKMCKLQGTTPCGKFKRQMMDSVTDISNCLLGTREMKSICVALASNVTIKELDLTGNNLSSKGAVYLAEALRENDTLEDLTMSECNISLEGLQAMADVFLEMKPMKRIDMSKNQFERRHADVISAIIKKNDYIEEFVLSGNKFDDMAGKALGKALESNVGIKKLDLSWNHLRRDGAKAVCMALKFNQTLEELNLSWNGLAEDGCRALGVALPCNHTLIELDISCNRISIFCLKEVLKGLQRNDTLKVLRIDQNPMTTEGGIAMLKCLGKSQVSQISDLYMTDIPINYEFLGELDELLKVRTVRVYHRDPNNKKITPIIRERTLKDYDPAMVLFEYMKQENLRLIDLFRTFDTDSNQTVSREELKEGFVTINMPLTEDALDSLFNKLDINENDEIEYDEVKSGYRKTMSKLRLSDNQSDNDLAAVAGLRTLIRGALKAKRVSMKKDAVKKVLGRRQSLRAIFEIQKTNKTVSDM